MKTKFRVLLSAFIVLLLGAMVFGVALADQTVNVKHATLTDVQGACSGTINYWHFVITQMTDATAPATIHVFWSNGAEEDVALLKVSGGVAHYETNDNAGYLVTDATAVVPDNWDELNGQFNLSHIGCDNSHPEPLIVTKTAVPSFTRTYTWELEKSVDVPQINTADSATFNYTVTATKSAPVDSDWAVSGVITVANPNNFDFYGVEVTDTLNANCTVTGGSNVTVPANGSVDINYSCPLASADPGTNTATATWDQVLYNTLEGSSSGSVDYVFGDPTKVVNDSIDVTDTNGYHWHFTETTTVQYSMTFTDPAGTCTDHVNTVTIDGTDQSASVTVKVCVGAPMTVSKTAAPSFTRTYKWDISKAVTPSRIEKVGGTATFNYTVNAWQTGFEDSDWVVSGVITVSNPNDWEAVDVTLSDELNVAGTCELASTSFSVPAGGSVDVKYSCDLPAAADGTNTATAAWDKAAAFTLTDSASGSADFAFVTPTSVVNKTITVTDTFNGLAPVTLGTLTATDAQPWASATYKYSQTVPVPTWNCVAYTNVARIVETGQSDSETVHVCGPTKTGALTMGFWQNKNGQGIISGGASTAGVCNSATWLRQFAPFQDLSATATCTQTAAYVFNVIKAANASGTSMNAMLKAQMLATALDVYFSSPTLGGNKIGAPVAIGSVAIDLTRICTDMSCSAYENVAPAFSGATHMTIGRMLYIASGYSNIGGSTWYGNVKAMQELAKDAFDAINNQKVFAW